MALINRVTRLFKADFHAVLDQIEEPEQVLKQAIRDMEDELQKTEQQIASCAHECELLGKRQGDLEESIVEMDAELDLCFSSGKTELAKGLVRRKLEAERVLRQLNGRLDANADFLSAQRRSLDDNRATLDGLRQKAELFSSRATTNFSHFDFDENAWLSRGMTVTDDEVEIAFLREQGARSSS